MAEGSGTPKTGKAKRRRRPRRKKSRPAGKGLLRSHLNRVEASLTAAVRETYAEDFGAHVDRARPFELEMKVSIDPAKSWRLQADPSLEEQIRAAVREMATKAEAFRRGRVYCYRCDSPVCPHSHPPRPTSVFGGYSSTGLPLWPEFSQILLEQGHPGVGLLYDASPAGLISMYVSPDMLKQRQMNIFGRQSKTYDILGQVVFGFLRMRVPGEGRSVPERVAFTLQAVEFRRLDGTPRLALNVLARLSDGSPALDAINGPYQLRVSDIISSARHRISSLYPSARGRARRGSASSLPDTTAHAADILKGLARKLEKAGRQRERRTAHAEGHRVKNRPTSKAWEDALGAPAESILWDRQEKTYVVLGPRSRAHVFSLRGRHVTSLVLSPEAVQSRKRRKRWLPITDDQRERFDAVVGRPAQETSDGHGREVLSRR